MGVPANVIALFSSFALAQAQGDLDLTGNDLEIMLGRKPTNLYDFLSKVYGATENGN